MCARKECPICAEPAHLTAKGYGFTGYPFDTLEVRCPKCRDYLITGTALAGRYGAALARSRSGEGLQLRLMHQGVLAERRRTNESNMPLLHELDVLSR